MFPCGNGRFGAQRQSQQKSGEARLAPNRKYHERKTEGLEPCTLAVWSAATE